MTANKSISSLMLPCTALVLSVILAFSAGCTSDNVNVGSPQGQQEPQVSLPQDEAQPTGTITFEAAGEWHIEISDSDGAVDEPDWLAVFPADGFAGERSQISLCKMWRNLDLPSGRCL